jgi:hypothetical protein
MGLRTWRRAFPDCSRQAGVRILAAAAVGVAVNAHLPGQSWMVSVMSSTPGEGKVKENSPPAPR